LPASSSGATSVNRREPATTSAEIHAFRTFEDDMNWFVDPMLLLIGAVGGWLGCMIWYGLLF